MENLKIPHGAGVIDPEDLIPDSQSPKEVKEAVIKYNLESGDVINLTSNKKIAHFEMSERIDGNKDKPQYVVVNKNGKVLTDFDMMERMKSRENDPQDRAFFIRNLNNMKQIRDY